MGATPFEAYLYFDVCILTCIFLYSLVRFVISLMIGKTRYLSSILFRALLIFSSASFIVHLVVELIKSKHSLIITFQVFVIIFTNALCLSYFYSILQFDALCREYTFRPCKVNTLLVVIILLISFTGLCQLCSYFIKTNASPFVFFFMNAISLFVLMEFILGYGSFHVGMTIKDLASDDIDDFYSLPKKLIKLSIIVLSISGVIGFGVFVASFCVSLDDQFFYNLFDGLCARAPMIMIFISSALFQELMDYILRHVRSTQPPATAALI